MKGNFSNIVNSDTPVLVDFYATWCGPCKAQTPIINDLAKDMNSALRVIKIDIDKNQNIAQQYQVRGVPTLALYKKGKLLWRASGVHSKAQLTNIIQPHLNE
ncbi:thioredoxin [Tamlana fucoidanivorans]|uniref:Thioredoxin n=1 Tax=Allotamlana fucoidanivorans TaxID=2583814 RepID=A0A5C4SEP6_9FLAO|nr:thioredoxin [Tamlana fucoidanivorans]TNJ41904.1 thioredoxin [Tamlana fucoidanivorans]